MQVPVPASQTWPVAAQSTQLTPPMPQAPSWAPGRHWPFLQHPLQLLGVQAGGGPPQSWVLGSQVLPMVVQSTQAVPPLPQALSVFPGTHLLPWQQPWAQVAGSQVGGGPVIHVPVCGSQLLPDSVQSMQGTPLMPQRLASAPLKHWPWLQHP
jgi:hypothetical protein